MTPELAAQKEKLHQLFQQLQLMNSKRARKSKAYRELEATIRAESARYEAMLVALDLPKE